MGYLQKSDLTIKEEICVIKNLHKLFVQASTAWLVINMRLVMWSSEIARIIVRLVRFPVIRVQVSYKAHLVSLFKLYL